MLFLLSPAKALDFETPAAGQPHTQPLFTLQSAELIALLREKSPQQISELMHLSDALSALNVARYQAWSPKFTAKNAKQAVLAFNGDVYGGLNAATLPADALAWTQEHLCILSGLYGVLRPLDWMQPYRLEMGTRLANPQGATLYKFWGTQISDYLNQRLRNDTTPVVVNLASQEYFKAGLGKVKHQHVDGVADNDHNALVAAQLHRNAAQNAQVFFEQIQPRLAGCAALARGDDDGLGVQHLGQRPGPHLGRRVKGRAVRQVHGLALGQAFARIKQQHLLRRPRLQHRYRHAGPDPAGTDDANGRCAHGRSF